ncbi:MAG: hypothetical protein J6Q14_00790 [Oscillospiraceae bacterium]|nr:hypothetical protein [Oscillospiraceae bacterium]
MNERKKAAQRQQEDIALNRAMLWFGAAMVLELLLLLVNKYFVNFPMDMVGVALVLEKVLIAAAVLGVLGGAACAVLAWKKLGAGQASPFRTVLCAVWLLALGISAGLVVRFGQSAMQVLYVLVPAGAVLALVYYLYQKEFFFSACGIGVGLLGLWLVRKNSGRHDVLVSLYMILGVLFLLGLVLLMFKLKKADGVLTVKGRALALLTKQSNFLLVVVSSLVSLAAMIAGLLLGGTAAFYLLFVLLAWLFLLLVYYTVRLM